MQKNLLLCACFSLLLFFEAAAQKADTLHGRVYYEWQSPPEGELDALFSFSRPRASPQNAVQLNMFSVLVGGFELSYAKMLGNNWAGMVHAGFFHSLSPYYYSDMEDYIFSADEMSGSRLGFEIRRYLSYKGFSGMYGLYLSSGVQLKNIAIALDQETSSGGGISPVRGNEEGPAAQSLNPFMKLGLQGLNYYNMSAEVFIGFGLMLPIEGSEREIRAVHLPLVNPYAPGANLLLGTRFGYAF